MMRKPLLLSCVAALTTALFAVLGCDELVTQVNNNNVYDPTTGQQCVACHGDDDTKIRQPLGQWENSRHASADLIEAHITLDDRQFDGVRVIHHSVIYPGFDNVMARNPMLCQPLSVWKRRFSDWIHTAEAEDLLYSSIFFDFRGGYGQTALIDELRGHLMKSLVDWSGFFRHLTQNALLHKPPLGFFRNFVVESKGEHRNKFDIKRAMLPIVDYARVYALKHGVTETNTLERLHQLMQKEVLPAKDYSEIEQGYGFMMQLRFARQVKAIIEEDAPPDNYINPKELSGLEQRLLKEIFIRIGNLQTRMSFDFTGEP